MTVAGQIKQAARTNSETPRRVGRDLAALPGVAKGTVLGGQPPAGDLDARRARFLHAGEWERHEATWLIWPHNPIDWPDKIDTVRWVYGEMFARLARASACACW